MKNERMNQKEILELFLNNKKEFNSYIKEVDKYNYIYVYGNDMYPSFDIMLMYLNNEIRNESSVLVMGKEKNNAEWTMSTPEGNPFSIPKGTYTIERYSNITRINGKFDNIVLLDMQDQKNKSINHIKWCKKYLKENGHIFIHEHNGNNIKNMLEKTEYDVFYILE